MTPLAALRPVRVGLLLSMLAILTGFSLGGAFGAWEEDIKEGLRADAEAVLAEKYGGDAARAEAVTSKAWSYWKRAHEHWGGIGAATLALGTLLGLAGGAERARAAIAIAMGAGALLYPLPWLLAARAAPGLGGTDAAKEAYEALFLLGAGLVLLGSIAAVGWIAGRLLGRDG